MINSIQYVTVSWNNGNDVASYTPWTTQSEKDALTSAVSSAQYVVNNTYATQSDITNSISNLNNAITVYKMHKNMVLTKLVEIDLPFYR